jgi:hypothetical protein
MSRAPFPIQPELTAIAIAFRNQAMVAERVLPSVPVGTQEFKYLQHNLAEGITLPDTKVGRGSRPNQVEFTATELTDACRDYGLDDPIPNADIENAPANFDPKGNATEYLTNLIELDREVRTAAKVTTAANYAATNKATLAGASQWSDYAGSDPVSAILTALDGMPIRANRLLLGQAVWTKLRQHPKVLAAVFPGGGNAASGGVASRQAVADLLELEELVIGSSWQNTAKKGQAANRTRVWGKFALAYYSPARISNAREMVFGFSAQWGDRIAGEIPDPNIGLRGGVAVRVGESRSETVSCYDAGFLWSDAVA